MITKKPKFSIVIPVYNGESTIVNAIKSCLEQSLPPDEIIVIDDASTDHTGLLIDQFASAGILYKRNDKNSGPSFCRNLGMQIAKSEWILFLDADDIFHNKKIEVISHFIMNNDAIKAIGHAFNLQTDPPYVLNNSWQETIPITKLTIYQLLVSNRMVTPSLAVAAANKILFNEEMKFAEDHDFIIRTAEKTDIWYLDAALCSLGRIPLSPGGISANKWKMRKGEINMYLDYCRRNRVMIAAPVFVIFSLLKHLKAVFTN